MLVSDNSQKNILIKKRNNLAWCLNECIESLVASGMMENILHHKIEKLLSQLMSMSTDIAQNASHNDALDQEINRIKALHLHSAIVLGHENRVKVLLQNGAQWHMRDNNQDYTALHLAALLGHVNIFSLLMEQFDLEDSKLDLNTVLSQKDPSGLNSTVSDHNDSMEGIPANKINRAIIRDHSTALHLACKASNPDKSVIIQCLLDRTASVKALDQDKRTPLHLLLSSNECQLDIFQALLQASIADGMNVINHPDNYGNTPLMAAVMRKEGPQPAVIQCLLEEGADFKIANKRHDTPQNVIARKIKIIKADLEYLRGARAKELEPSKQEVDNNLRDLDLQIKSHEQRLDTLRVIADLYLSRRYNSPFPPKLGESQNVDRKAGNHSSSSASSSAIHSSAQSRYGHFAPNTGNQKKSNRYEIHIKFEQLARARVITGEERLPAEFPSLDKMKNLMHLEDCIVDLNGMTEIGLIPPREYMNAILKKFQTPTMSTNARVSNLYKIMCDKFSDIPCDDEIVKISTHSEMMLNLIRRNDDIFDKRNQKHYQYNIQTCGEENCALSVRAEWALGELETIYNKNPHPWTYNVLLEGYLKTQQYSDFKSLYLKHQDWHDDWTFAYYIKYISLMHGIYAAHQAFWEIFEQYPENIGETTAVTLLKLHRGRKYQEIKNIYDSLPEKLQRTNGTRKELIISLMRSPENFHKARSIYDDMTNKVESIYEAMMKGYSTHAEHFKDALDIYGQAVEAGHFEKNKPQEGQDGQIGQIDLHLYALRGEVPNREGVPPYLMKLCLIYYKADLIQLAANGNGKLKIISGKGTFKAKAEAKKILTEEFGWDVYDDSTNAGCFFCVIKPGLQSDNSNGAEASLPSLHS